MEVTETIPASTATTPWGVLEGGGCVDRVIIVFAALVVVVVLVLLLLQVPLLLLLVLCPTPISHGDAGHVEAGWGVLDVIIALVVVVVGESDWAVTHLIISAHTVAVVPCCCALANHTVLRYLITGW